MAKCGICGEDKENYLEVGDTIFDCDVPMCEECYHKFLKEHWEEIWNAVLEVCKPSKEVREMIYDFDLMNRTLDAIK